MNSNFYIVKANQKTAVIKVELLPKLELFVISQASGVVGFYNIRTCELLSYMNEGTWSPLMSKIMRQQVRELKATGVYDAFEDSSSGEEESSATVPANQRLKLDSMHASNESSSANYKNNYTIEQRAIVENFDTDMTNRRLLMSPLSEAGSN